jgi:hypothetical protein
MPPFRGGILLLFVSRKNICKKGVNKMMSLVFRRAERPFACLSRAALSIRAFSTIKGQKCFNTRIAIFERMLTDIYATDNSFLATAQNHLPVDDKEWLVEWIKKGAKPAYTHCGITACVVRNIALETLFDNPDISAMTRQTGSQVHIHAILHGNGLKLHQFCIDKWFNVHVFTLLQIPDTNEGSVFNYIKAI